MASLNNARRSAASLCVLLLGAVVAACGGGSTVDPILGPPGLGVAPTVTSTSPVAASPAVVGVATNARISAAFSKDIDPASVTGTSFSLACPAGTPVLASVSYDAATRVATLIAAAALPATTVCVATLTTAIRDTTGFAMVADFAWSFVTASAADTTPPTVTLTVPAPGATAVANNTAITATFSEDMNATTITATSFTVVNSALGTPVAGSVAYSSAGRTAIFTPTTPATLASNTQFTGTITTAATDLAGNALAASYVWSFTTAALPDTTRPTVTLTVPAAGATAVPNNTAITATFSEDMNPTTITGATFTLVNSTLGAAVPGVVSYSATSRTAIFTPSTPATLAANSQFTATITTGASDLAGNGLAANFVWTFTTAALPDTTRPTVTVTVPAPGATAVANNTAITATFSEDMNPATISGSTFTLVNSTLGTAVVGNVSYSATSRSAIFTPTTPATLADNSQFTATVTTGANDLAGNGLAANFVWTFTTTALPDTTRPTVTLTVPSQAATLVANNTAVTATFSEAMNPATISVTSFTIVNTTLGTPVGGTVSYSVPAATATFVPTGGVLASSSVFTATVTVAATDLAGNALAGNTAVLPGSGNHVWTFTTAALPDTIAPTVTAVSPQDGSVAVCLGRTVSATFSEAMDAATIGPLTFVVTATGVPVAGTVLYDAPTRVASFTPSAPAGFTANTALTVTVRGGATGVKDLAGNPLVLDRSWGFTTGTQACIAPIDLRSVAAFGGFGGAAGMTNQGTNTVIGGNIGSTAVCTAITGFHDATDVYTETPLNVGGVNGTIYCAPPAPGTITRLAIAAQARADAQSAYDAMTALPAGGDPGAGQLGGLTLPAAVYTAAGGAFVLTLGDLTLDGQGDPNAVWVFQMTAALTVGTPTIPGRVLLINGAQAKNVFWRVGSAARIEDRSVMVGTIIAPAGLTISTSGQTQQTTLTGRAISLTASVTVVNTTVVAP
ncbi:MAG: Ig-like domain-containing protein [Caldimonas sp.]